MLLTDWSFLEFPCAQCCNQTELHHRARNAATDVVFVTDPVRAMLQQSDPDPVSLKLLTDGSALFDEVVVIHFAGSVSSPKTQTAYR